MLNVQHSFKQQQQKNITFTVKRETIPERSMRRWHIHSSKSTNALSKFSLAHFEDVLFAISQKRNINKNDKDSKLNNVEFYQTPDAQKASHEPNVTDNHGYTHPDGVELVYLFIKGKPSK